MKKSTSFFCVCAVFLLINFSSCKKNEQTKPVESPEIANLKQFYATTANVKVNLINYDASKDEFSINGGSKISHAKLSMFYGLIQNKGTVIPAKSTSIHN